MQSIADLKGLRIRVQQSELMSQMIRALGAEPVELPYGQVLTGLATHLIDGAENNWPSFVTTDHYKYAGYYTLTEHTMSPEVLVMSLKAWRSLSADDQQIFREAALRSSQFMREKWRDLEEQSQRKAEAAGVTIVKDIDRKPFEDAMAPIYAKAAQRSRRGRADRTHPQGGVSRLGRARTQRVRRAAARPDRAAARAARRRCCARCRSAGASCRSRR